MKALEEKIVREGEILPGGILKVGSFLNQQIDTDFMMEMGEEIYRLFRDEKITKILTIEASGITLAFAAASCFHVPTLFAKKNKSNNVSGEVYRAKVHSYTHGNDFFAVLSREYLSANDRVLLVDDFLATGEAFLGLIEICRQAGAEIVGCVAAVEKAFQEGESRLKSEGLRVEALARVSRMDPETGIAFC